MTILLLPSQFGCLLFPSLACAWAGTSRTVFNKSDESGHPCLAPDFKGKAFSFSPLRMMLTVGLSYMAFIMLRYAQGDVSLFVIY